MARHIRIAAALASVSTISLGVGASPAYAQAPEDKRSYNIEAQALSGALSAYAEQSGIEIIFTPEAVRGKRSNVLRGSYGPAEALSLLLRGTGLFSRRGSGTALIITSERPSGIPDDFGRAALAEGAVQGAADEDREIVVTGSIIRGAAPAGANLIVLDRGELERTGRGTLAEAIQTTPQLHGGGANDFTQRSGAGSAPNLFGSQSSIGTASLNLRGLGVEETLTILNGRRLAPAGDYGAIADVSMIPMAAVARVEILADGASATYGADAMAGVINIITDRRFEGAETRLRAGFETRTWQPELQASQTFGWTSDRGNIMVSADYLRREPVPLRGRRFAETADQRPLGGRDWRTNYCSPGNIIFPPELAGAIPAGGGGSITPDQIRLGESNLCDAGSADRYLTPSSERASVFISGLYELTGRLRVSLDLLGSARRSSNAVDAFSTLLEVPTSNAYRHANGFSSAVTPFDLPVYIAYQFAELGSPIYRDDVWTILASGGFEYALGTDWKAGLHATYGRYDRGFQSPILDSRPAEAGGRLALALASGDPQSAFNPFGDATANSRQLVESFFHRYRLDQISDYRSVDFRVGGTLEELPGGAARIALGGEYRRENLTIFSRFYYPELAPGYSGAPGDTQSRDVTAIFAELFLPIFGPANAMPGLRRLELSASGRYDHYSDFGGSFNPKVGLSWSPIGGVAFRGAFGTSFKAPFLPNLYDQSTLLFTAFPATVGAPDANGDGYVDLAFFYGGNPLLRPERGRSWTAGFDVRPSDVPGLHLYATYFNLRFRGRFAQASDPFLIFLDPDAFQNIAYFPAPTSQQVEVIAAAAERVIGAAPPSGVEAIIDVRTLNFSSQVMEGIDAGVNYSRDGLGGTIQFSGDLAYISRYKSRLGESSATTNYLGIVGLPARWKARGTIGWSREGTNLSVAVNHVSGYSNSFVAPTESIASYQTVDFSLRLPLSGIGRGPSFATTLDFHVTNLFDADPPFVNGAGYDGANADPVGRRVAVQLTTRW